MAAAACSETVKMLKTTPLFQSLLKNKQDKGFAPGKYVSSKGSHIRKVAVAVPKFFEGSLTTHCILCLIAQQQHRWNWAKIFTGGIGQRCSQLLLGECLQLKPSERAINSIPC